jgi:hypothetical protein
VGATLASPRPAREPPERSRKPAGGESVSPPQQEAVAEAAAAPGTPRYLSPGGGPVQAARELHAAQGPVGEAAQEATEEAAPLSQALDAASERTRETDLEPPALPEAADTERPQDGAARAREQAQRAAAGEPAQQEERPGEPAEPEAAPAQDGGGDGEADPGGEGQDAGSEGGAAGGNGGGAGGDGGTDGGPGTERARGSGAGSGADAATGKGGADAGLDSLEALGTGDLALIDTELAEHQRWGAAAQRVGAAGSAARADFVVQQAGAGALGGLGHAFGTGFVVGAGTKLAEVGVARLVTRLAGAALARSFPLPAIGAVIGGVMSAYDLATRDWSRTGETIGRFGEGASIYEQLANSIAAVSEIIGIATAVLNVIAGVIGAISIAMWVITVLTVGVATPLAATLSTIAGAIGIGTMILDGINAMVLQRLVTMFRALHTFTSNSDPLDVEQQGGRIGEAAGASAGFLGGMAGGLAGAGAAGAGARRLGLSHEPPAHVPDHETPPAAQGEGPTVTADPPPATEGPAAPGGEHPGATPEGPGQILPPPDPNMPMPEIPAPPPVPEIGPLPDYGPELPGHPEAPALPAEPQPVRIEPPGAPVDPTGPTQRPVDPTAPTERPAAPGEPAVPEGRRIADDQSAGASPSAPGPAAEPAPAGPAAPADPTSFADFDSLVREVGESPFGERLASEAMAPMQDVPRDTTRSAGAVRDAAYADIPNERPAGWDGPGGRQDQHWTKVRDATVNAAPGTPPATVEAINANRSPLQTPRAGEATLLLTTEGVPASEFANPAERGTDYFIDHDKTGRVGEPRRTRGAQGTLPFGPPEAPFEPSYRSEHRFADRYLIPEMRRQIAESRARAGLPPLDDVQLTVAAGEQARYVMEGVPATDLQQRPVQPWSGRVVEPARTPVQMLLAPEVLSPELHAQGRTVEVPSAGPRPEPAGQLPLDFNREAPNPNQLSLPLEEPASPRRAGEGETRSTEPLSDAEFEAHAAMAESMGMPRDQIQRGSRHTAYIPGSLDTLLIGPDINPLPEGQRPTGLANPANAALEPRAVLGHEVIGHREAELMGQARDEPWHEELQASARAGLHTPGLSPQQRWLLIQDAAARRRFQTREGEIYINTERPGDSGPGTSRGEPRPASAFRPQDQQPSVIVNWEALGMQPPEGAPAAPRSPSGTPDAAGPRPVPGAGTPRTATTAPPSTWSRMMPYIPGSGIVRGVGDVYSQWFGDERMRAPQGVTYDATARARIARGGRIGSAVGAAVGGGPVGAAVGGFVGQRVGEGVARRAEDFAAGRERGHEPIVEHVIPAYPEPPGTPQDMVNLQNRLIDILDARARAEQLERATGADAAHHEANAAPLDQFQQQTQATITATQAHEQAVAHREAANQQRQSEEGNVTSTLGNYADRAAGLAMITEPLRAFTAFTYLAHALPDSPNVLQGAKRGILKMNTDGQHFLEALDGADSAVQEQQAAQPARQGEIDANAGRIAAVSSGAAASQAQLRQSATQGQALAQRNDARAQESRGMEQRAGAAREQASGEAEETRGQIQSLSAQWQGWAAAHRRARELAVAQTRERMIAAGYRPRDGA